MKTQNYLFLIIILSFCFSLLPLVSSAQGLVPCGNPGQPPCQLCHIFVLFKNVVNFLLTRIVPAIAVLMIAIAGFMYLFAYFGVAASGDQGSPTLLSRAKQTISYTIIGLIIIYGAWLIVNLFFQIINVQDWTGLRGGWWRINCPLQ